MAYSLTIGYRAVLIQVALPTFVSANFVPPPAGWAAPVGDPFGAAGYLWPAAYPVPDPYADAGTVSRRNGGAPVTAAKSTQPSA